MASCQNEFHDIRHKYSKRCNKLLFLLHSNKIPRRWRNFKTSHNEELCHVLSGFPSKDANICIINFHGFILASNGEEW